MITSSFHVSRLTAARAAFQTGDLETAFRETRTLLRRFGSPPFPLPVAGGLADVDFLLAAIGRKLHEEFTFDANSSQGGDWILATCIYETGGHTPVMNDLAAALPGGLRGMVLTLTAHDEKELTPRALARTGLPKESVLRADAPTMLDTCRNVLRIFRSRPPRRLFLFQYPDDTAAVAAAAALAAAGTELWLVHHADSYPSAGLFLPGLRILDVTPAACAFVRHVLGLQSRFLPLTCPDPCAAPPDFLKRGHLTTALSGSVFKTSQVSAISYQEVVVDVLRATGGTHVHIGPLLEQQRASIRTAISAAGLKETQFVHVPIASTLVEALRSGGVDLLINTWPIGGARAAVEAMAAGVPTVWHAPHETMVRLWDKMAYPGAAFWHLPQDLAALAGKADKTWLLAQSQAARRRYEEQHHPSLWRNFFAAPESAPDVPLPAGYGASRFLPALWNSLVDLAVDNHDSGFANLRDRLKKQQEKLNELGAIKNRLRALESEFKETRFPWIVRLWRRWRRSGAAGKDSS